MTVGSPTTHPNGRRASRTTILLFGGQVTGDLIGVEQLQRLQATLLEIGEARHRPARRAGGAVRLLRPR